MRGSTIKKINQRKSPNKSVSDRDFWNTIALQQQAIIHAKNRT